MHVREDCRGMDPGQDLVQFVLPQATGWQIVNVVAVIFAYNQAGMKLFLQFGGTIV